MKEWTFRVFVNDDGFSDVREWIRTMPAKARARMDKILFHLEITKDWTQTSWFAPLKGYRGICEIKFTVDDTQYRPLGCYGPGKAFTLLKGAIEQGDEFNPRGAPEIALERRELVLAPDGTRYTYEYH